MYSNTHLKSGETVPLTSPVLNVRTFTLRKPFVSLATKGGAAAILSLYKIGENIVNFNYFIS